MVISVFEGATNCSVLGQDPTLGTDPWELGIYPECLVLLERMADSHSSNHFLFSLAHTLGHWFFFFCPHPLTWHREDKTTEKPEPRSLGSEDEGGIPCAIPLYPHSQCQSLWCDWLPGGCGKGKRESIAVGQCFLFCKAHSALSCFSQSWISFFFTSSILVLISFPPSLFSCQSSGIRNI